MKKTRKTQSGKEKEEIIRKGKKAWKTLQHWVETGELIT